MQFGQKASLLPMALGIETLSTICKTTNSVPGICDREERGDGTPAIHVPDTAHRAKPSLGSQLRIDIGFSCPRILTLEGMQDLHVGRGADTTTRKSP